MSKQANIEATERWGAEVASAGKFDVLDEILHPNFVDHDPAPDQGPGIEGMKGFFRQMRTAFPDLSAEVVEMTATDDHLAMRYTLSGTHDGPFQGIAGTGKRFEVAAVQLGRYEGGRCIERWGSTDELGMLKQLGLLEQIVAAA